MLIEFEGEISGECRKFMIKKQVFLQALATFITALIISPFGFVVYAFGTVKPMGLLIALTPFLLFGICLFPPTKKTQKKIFPNRVYFELEDEIVTRECKSGEMFYGFDKIREIKDYGEWYYLQFELFSRDPYFVCQKSLLTQGSIEQFEELFADKIIRQY